MPSGQQAEERAWLVFRLGPHQLCASALDVEGIIEPVRPRPVPFTPPYVLGWFDFRGEVASVVSLRRKFGVHGEDGASGPYVVARVQGDLAAFWVDEVRDVLEAHQANWKPMPPMPGAAVFDRYTIRDAEVILHATFEGLLRADATVAFPAPAEAPAKAVPVAKPELEPAPARTEEQRVPPEPVPPPAPARPHEATSAPRKPARFEAPRPVPGAPRRPERRAVEPPPPPMPRPYEPRDFEVAAAEPEAPEQSRTRWSWRWAVAAVLIVLAAGGALVWRSSVPQAPPAAPATAAGPIVQPDSLPATTRIATVKTDAFTLTVDRPARRAPAPAAKPNPERTDGRITHVVVRGDTLSHIAYRYLGDGARYPELARLSRIRDPDLIHPGDIVTIRQTAPPGR